MKKTKKIQKFLFCYYFFFFETTEETHLSFLKKLSITPSNIWTPKYFLNLFVLFLLLNLIVLLILWNSHPGAFTQIIFPS